MTDDPHADEEMVVSGAPRGAADAAIVALHGRGATAQGVTNLVEPLARHGVTVFAPQAARSRWYPYGPDAPTAENEPYVRSAVDRVAEAVTRAEAAGVPRARVLVFGFSQGATIACEFAARRGGVGAVVALAGGLLESAREYSATLSGTEVFLGVGREDDRVRIGGVRATADVLASLGASVDLAVYDGVGHEVTDDEFARANALLDAIRDAS